MTKPAMAKQNQMENMVASRVVKEDKEGCCYMHGTKNEIKRKRKMWRSVRHKSLVLPTVSWEVVSLILRDVSDR